MPCLLISHAIFTRLTALPEQKKAIEKAPWIKLVATKKFCLSILRHIHNNVPRNLLSPPLSIFGPHPQILYASHCRPMLGASLLLGHDSDHALEQCSLDTSIVTIRLQMGDCWFPRSLGIDNSATANLLSVLQNQRDQSDHRDLLRKAELASPLGGSDPLSNSHRSLVFLLPGMDNRRFCPV